MMFFCRAKLCAMLFTRQKSVVLRRQARRARTVRRQ